MLLLFVSLFLNIACDDDNADKQILLMEIYNEYDYGYDNYSIEYNSSNKISKMTNTYSSGNGEEIITINYEYDNNGKLLFNVMNFGDGFKVKSINTYAENTFTYTNYELFDDGTLSTDCYGEVITYDADGYIILSQFFYCEDDEKYFSDSVVYEWDGNNMIESNLYFLNNSGTKRACAISKPETFVMSIMKNKKVGIMANLKSSNTELHSTQKFTYDDKKNPMALLGLDFYFEAQNLNNIISQVYSQTGDQNNSWSHTAEYEYNEHNYPTKGVIKEGESKIVAITYVYN